MVRIEELQDETVKVRQDGTALYEEDDQDWEVTDDDSDEVGTVTAGC